MPNDHWITPPWLVHYIREAMGSIDLDACSSPTANVVSGINAPVFFSEADPDRAFATNWAGSVYMNPPYSQPLINDFVQRACDQIPRVKRMTILVNSSTETKWYQRLLDKCNYALFLSRRIAFIDPDTGKETRGNRYAQTLFTVGYPWPRRFALGRVVVL